MVTAYDEPSARLCDAAGVDLLLVGDSVANTVLGYPDTLHVTIDDMARHTAAVARATPAALVVGDLPWMSYHTGVDDAVRNAATLVRAGAGCVKLEGGAVRTPVVEAILGAEIPVMGHLGLTPAVGARDGGLPRPGPGPRGREAPPRGRARARGRGLLRARARGRARRARRRGSPRTLDDPDDRHRRGPVDRRPGARLPRPARPRQPPAREVRARVRPARHAGDRGDRRASPPTCAPARSPGPRRPTPRARSCARRSATEPTARCGPIRCRCRRGRPRSRSSGR